MGCSPSSSASPSTVSTSAPSACTASTRHESDGRPSTSTVQAPQAPCSQPTCVPVSPSPWRRKSESSVRGSARPTCSRPLTRRRTARSSTRDPRGQQRAQRRHTRGLSPVARRSHAGRPRAPRRRPRAPPPPLRRRPAPARAPPRRRGRRTARRRRARRARGPGRRRRPRRPARSRRAGGRSRRTRSGLRQGAAGMRSAVSSSPSASAVENGPRKRAEAGIARSPPAEATIASPSSASSTAGSSAAGSACAMLPPTVPRLRVAGWPTCCSASASSGARSATSDERRASAWRVVAPSRSAPLAEIPESEATRPTSTSADGRARRRLSIGTRLCPPASTLASPPHSASIATASSTVSAAR